MNSSWSVFKARTKVEFLKLADASRHFSNNAGVLGMFRNDREMTAEEEQSEEKDQYDNNKSGH